jgi:hypothetical protein
MTHFRYEAFTKTGHVKKGFLDANSSEEASGQLRAMGLFVQAIEVDGPSDMKAVLPAEKEEYTAEQMVELNEGEMRSHLDWKEELTRNLQTISEVIEFAEASKLRHTTLLAPCFNAAYSELVKAALLRAVKSH